MSVKQLLVVTRISSFSVQPTQVVVGGSVTISGKLEWQVPLVGWWYALTGVDVKLLMNSGEVNSATTDSNGAFTFTQYFPNTGSYLMKVKYPGDILRDPTVTQEILVTVITQDDKDKQNQQLLIFGLMGVVTIIMVAAIVSR